LRSSEKIGDDWESTSLHSIEQQRRPDTFNHQTMNLGDFEIWIDFNIDRNQIIFAAQEVEEGTKISVHQVFLCVLCGYKFHHRGPQRMQVTSCANSRCSNPIP